MIAIALAMSASACVFPSDTPTGLELSWLFHETNTSDGDDALRVLTCKGVAIEGIAVALVDVDHPERNGTFRFACEDGFQTANDLARRASEAFIELHPRDYDVTLTEDVADDPQTLASRTVDVLARSVTLEQWELARTPVEQRIELVHTDMCSELALGLFYDDPEAALAEPPEDDDGDVPDVLYREQLVSDRGLGLAGTPGPCAGLEGTHAYAAVDPGTYRLDVTIDGATCSRRVEVGAGATVIDVTAMPCG
ncbi:MAG TPA: hypothetical protein VG755_23555 [Nannocystaceae bacterium]|nr:hypothetical protein [Nannocystaceae bacterium]